MMVKVDEDRIVNLLHVTDIREGKNTMVLYTGADAIQVHPDYTSSVRKRIILYNQAIERIAYGSFH